MGIDTRAGVQMVFLDTPGLVDPRYLLHRSMLHIALEGLREADVVLLLVDAATAIPQFHPEVLERLSAHPRLIVVSNKRDLAGAERMRDARRWAEEHFGSAPMEVSAATGDGVDALRTRVAALLPESPYLYPEDDASSQSVRFFVAELVRETVFEQYEKEIPYSVAVKVEEFRENAEPIYISATVFVERPTQKAILIGKAGAAIRQLGTAARVKIEDFVGASVYLDLWVKVLPKWRKDALSLQRLGFPVPDPE